MTKVVVSNCPPSHTRNTAGGNYLFEEHQERRTRAVRSTGWGTQTNNNDDDDNDYTVIIMIMIIVVVIDR